MKYIYYAIKQENFTNIIEFLTSKEFLFVLLISSTYLAKQRNLNILNPTKMMMRPISLVSHAD